MSIRTAIRVGPVDREHSIRNYLLRIYDKLGLSSCVELVLYAVSGTDSTPLPTQEQVRPGHIIHKTDQPDVVVHFFDPRGLTGEDRADVGFISGRRPSLELRSCIGQCSLLCPYPLRRPRFLPLEGERVGGLRRHLPPLVLQDGWLPILP